MTERALIALASASVVADQANSPNSVRKGEVKEGGAPRHVGSNTPRGAVLAPFWLHVSIQKTLRCSIDFLNDFGILLGSFLDRFWSHFGVVSGTKRGTKAF